MRKNAKRRLFIMIFLILVILAILVLTNVFDLTMEPSAYKYYIEKIPENKQMPPNAVTAIYLRYRIFDTLFEALLLAMAVSAVVYFASPWEKDKEEKKDE